MNSNRTSSSEESSEDSPEESVESVDVDELETTKTDSETPRTHPEPKPVVPIISDIEAFGAQPQRPDDAKAAKVEYKFSLVDYLMSCDVTTFVLWAFLALVIGCMISLTVVLLKGIIKLAT